jgi:AcrR family transcriptional regulator
MSEMRKAPSPGPGRLSAEQAAELPDRLLDAAEELFSQDGFAKTTMERIAKAAGASTKTLYSRYDNKAEILRDVVRRMADRTIAAQMAVTPPDPRDIAPAIYLNGLCGRIAHRIAEEAAGINRLAFSEARHVPEIARMHAEVTARGRGLIQASLEAWRDQGLLPLLEDAPKAAALCLSMTTDAVRIRTALGEPNDQIDADVAFAVEIFLRGLGHQAS